MADVTSKPVAPATPPKPVDPVIKKPVTATVTQPPGGQVPGGQVTEVHKKDAESNILNQAEAAQQAHVREGVGGIKIPLDYNYSIEQGSHKLTVSVENGLSYNFHVVCSGCDWEGRYLTQSAAESAAQEHLALKFPIRG